VILYPKTHQENEALKEWLSRHLDDYSCNDHTYCIAVSRNDELVAVVAYDNYKKVDMELSIFATTPRWISRQTLSMILGYPFLQLSCQRVTALVHKSNKRCRRLLMGIGFEQEGKHRHAGPNLETIFSYGMTRQDFMERYINGQIKQETPTDTAAAA